MIKGRAAKEGAVSELDCQCPAEIHPRQRCTGIRSSEDWVRF